MSVNNFAGLTNLSLFVYDLCTYLISMELITVICNHLWHQLLQPHKYTINNPKLFNKVKIKYNKTLTICIM